MKYLRKGRKKSFPLVFFFFDLAGLIKIGFVIREHCYFGS